MDTPKCALCGEPMPEGEEMFKFHGYSGPCPKPPLPLEVAVPEKSYEALIAERDELKDILEMQDAILNPGIGINEQDRDGYTIQVLRKDLWFVQSNRERDKALAEVERLEYLHNLDHSLADQWAIQRDNALAEVIHLKNVELSHKEEIDQWYKDMAALLVEVEELKKAKK